VSHTDPQALALRALGEHGEPDAHLADCSACQAELRRLTAAVTVARQADAADRLHTPSPEVWNRIAAATGVSATGGSGVASPARSPSPARSTAARSRRRRRVWPPRRPLAAVLAGVLAVLLVAAGAATAVRRLRAASGTGTAVVTRIALRPLPQFPQWQDASGSAVMESGSGGTRLTVMLRAPRRPGYYEVWLLARNGVSMISLGDLDSSHAGQFSMPPGVNLRNYSRIDISLQPYNGSTVHVRASVVRGSLPALPT
jgi:hypothetical protein